jgi:hypothetical protein
MGETNRELEIFGGGGIAKGVDFKIKIQVGGQFL